MFNVQSRQSFELLIFHCNILGKVVRVKKRKWIMSVHIYYLKFNLMALLNDKWNMRWIQTKPSWCWRWGKIFFFRNLLLPWYDFRTFHNVYTMATLPLSIIGESKIAEKQVSKAIASGQRHFFISFLFYLSGSKFKNNIFLIPMIFPVD